MSAPPTTTSNARARPFGNPDVFTGAYQQDDGTIVSSPGNVLQQKFRSIYNYHTTAAYANSVGKHADYLVFPAGTSVPRILSYCYAGIVDNDATARLRISLIATMFHHRFYPVAESFRDYRGSTLTPVEAHADIAALVGAGTPIPDDSTAQAWAPVNRGNLEDKDQLEVMMGILIWGLVNPPNPDRPAVHTTLRQAAARRLLDITTDVGIFAADNYPSVQFWQSLNSNGNQFPGMRAVLVRSVVSHCSTYNDDNTRLMRSHVWLLSFFGRGRFARLVALVTEASALVAGHPMLSAQALAFEPYYTMYRREDQLSRRFAKAIEGPFLVPLEGFQTCALDAVAERYARARFPGMVLNPRPLDAGIEAYVAAAFEQMNIRPADPSGLI